MAEKPNRRLDNWGEIAKHIKRDVSTVMRWAKDRGLPVHRVPGGKRPTVYAFTEEIDRWLASGRGDGRNGVAGSGAVVAVENGAGQPRRVNESGENGISSDATQRTRVTYRSVALGVGLGIVGVLAIGIYFLAGPQPMPRLLGNVPLTSDGRPKSGNLVTDGKNLYFVESLPGGKNIVRIPATGGDPAILSTPLKDPHIEDLNVARREILFIDPNNVPGTRSALWAEPLEGGAPRRVGAIFADVAAWTPHGNGIVYAEGSELFRCKSDGSEARKIATLPGTSTSLCWMTDGTRLRVTCQRSGKYASEILEMGADGSDPQLEFGEKNGKFGYVRDAMTPFGKFGWVLLQGPKISGLCAFAEDRKPFWFQKAVPTPLSSGPLNIDGFVVSGDKPRVFVLGGLERDEMLRYDKVGKQFVRFLPTIAASDVDFARDSGSMAYASNSNPGLWRRRSDGSEPVRLTPSPMSVELPRWSPDGKTIAFMGQKTLKDPWQVFVIPEEGGPMRAIFLSDFPEGAPTWSPDGTQLAFGEMLVDNPHTPDQIKIHIVNLKTQKGTTLPGSTGLWTARWSPDGNHLAAITADAKGLMLFDFHTQKWAKVAAAVSISDLNWNRNSEEIYFEDRLGPHGAEVLRASLSNGQVEKIASLSATLPIYSPWLGLTPDDSPLVSNFAGSTEIYGIDWTAK